MGLHRLSVKNLFVIVAVAVRRKNHNYHHAMHLASMRDLRHGCCCSIVPS
jgi:hypothetical protein